MLFIRLLIPALLGYLIGSVNLSRLITKYVGKFDITKKGSGNAGGTNVARTMGAKWGVIAICLEILKSLAVGILAEFVWPTVFTGGLGELEPAIVGSYAVFFCLLGNVYPVFYGFKGGKGVSTFAAAAILIDWRIFLIGISVFFIFFLASRTVSLGSLTAALTVPITTALFHCKQDNYIYLVIIVSLITLTVFIKHASNIKRLISGTENKFTFGKKK